MKMSKCQACHKIYHQKKRLARFCSRPCANIGLRSIKDPLERFFKEKITRLKGNAKKRKIKFSIDWKDLYLNYEKQSGKCFYTRKNMDLTYSTKTAKVCPPNQLSVDRIDSNRGYEPDNIVLCCFAINNLKGDSNLQDFQEYLSTILLKKTIKLPIKKLHPDAVIPKYAKSGDAAMDLVATSIEYNLEAKQYIYGVGLAMEIPVNHVGLIYPRSSIVKTSLTLANSTGVVDSGYRGEIKAVFNYNENNPNPKYNIGDRICQIIIMPVPQVETIETENLSETERGQGGFGSSGK